MKKFTRGQIFVALDVKDKSQALSLLQKIGSAIDGIKIGLEFFSAFGPAGIKEIRERTDKPLFLDLKFHDIPNTVAGAIRAITSLKPALLTLHASGGIAMLRAAREAAHEQAAKDNCPPPLLLGVTLLTSLDDEDLKEIGFAASMKDQVSRLGLLCQKAGLDGLVCSGREIAPLRQLLGEEIHLVVPGIRPSADGHGDQKRAITPRDAISAGADILVIGRPITEAVDPVAAVALIRQSMGDS